MAFCAKLLIFVLFIFLILLEISCIEDAVQYRLPNNTAPEHYEIKIYTKLEEDGFRFSGICKITINVLEDTDKIILHSKLSDIRGVEVLPLGSFNGNITGKVEKNDKNDFLIINLKERQPKGKTLTLKLWYFSELRTDQLGFYRLSYINEFGNKIWLATTQFAATEARHAFPCYDEPNRKATFQLEIRHPQKLKAISNTDHYNTIEYGDGTLTTQFQKTEKMSTYLVAFLISDLTRWTIGTPTTHEVYGVPQKIFDLNASSNFSVNLFNTFTNYFKIPFPVSKIFRQVVLPDLHFNAMENWAMIIYRENSFIYKENIHSEVQKIRAITLTGHEMAHCWFGNLVTMDWWTYVWLNEGFATLYAYYGAQMAYPQYEFIELFLVQQMHPVLMFDSKFSTRPMSKYVENQNDIMKGYDKIAYEKAACVLRMWENAFGRQYFQIAVENYLRENKFKNVNENNLINALNHAMPNTSLEDIENTIKSWTSKKGYPILTVERYYENPYTIKLIQQGNFGELSVWQIPINFVRKNGNEDFNDTTADLWMNRRDMIFYTVLGSGKNMTVGPQEWIILNKQQTGYYRVNYDIRNWELLIQALKTNHKDIHVLNRAQLIDDAFALSDVGKLNYTIPLKLISYMTNETSYAPWATLRSRFLELKRLSHGTTSYSILVKYIGKLTENGSKNKTLFDSPMTKLTNEILLKFFCEYNPKNCPVKISSIARYPHLRFVYYCKEINLKKEQTYFKIRTILREENDSLIRKDLLSALSCTKNETFLTTILYSTIEIHSDLILTQFEREFLLENIYQSGEIGLNLTLRFISTQSKLIEYIMPGYLAKIVPDIAKYVNTQELRKMFEVMVNKLGRYLDIYTLSIANSEITSNIKWNLLNKHNIDAFEASLNCSSYYCISLWVVIFILLNFLS